MRIAFTHNLRLTDSEDEAEFDSVETVDAIADGAPRRRSRGRENRSDRPGLAPGGSHRIVRARSDLQQRRGAEGARARGVLPGDVRGAGVPLHRLGRLRPDGHAGQVADQAGARQARDRHAAGPAGHARRVPADARSRDAGAGAAGDRQAELRRLVERDRRRGRGARRPRAGRAPAAGAARLSRPACWSRSSWPASTSPSPFLEGRGDEGVLLPVDYLVDPPARSRFNLYDYRLKSAESNRVSVRCPPDQPRDVVSRLRAHLQDGGARARHPRRRPDRLPDRRGRAHLSSGGQRPPLAGTGGQPLRRGGARGARLRRVAARHRRERGRAARAGGQAGGAAAAPGRSAAHRLHLQRQARRLEGRQRRRGRVRRPRDDRRHPRGAGELRPQ